MTGAMPPEGGAEQNYALRVEVREERNFDGVTYRVLSSHNGFQWWSIGGGFRDKARAERVAAFLLAEWEADRVS